MENVNCLLTSFPWDLFLFLLILGILLWPFLHFMMKKKCEKKVNELNSLIAELESSLAKAKKSAAPARKDELKKIEGIGPKIQQLLYDAGIYTFEELADTDPVQIKAILDEGGPNFYMHDPSTWPRQASLARDGKWDELKKWQDELDGGKE